MKTQLLTAILKYIKEGVFFLGADLRIVYVNPSAVRMCGSTEKTILGKPALQTIVLLDPKSLDNYLRIMPSLDNPYHFKDSILKVGGNTLIVDGSITALKNHHDGILGYVIITRDVGELKKLRATLDYQASHDKLTGFINREGFAVQLDSIVDLVKLGGGSEEISGGYTLMQINIDGFRRVTGAAGVNGGNAILIQFASTIKSVIQENSIPARLTNDIFAVICMKNDSEAVAHRLHEAVRHTVFSYAGKTFPLTASIGMLQITEKAAFAESLLFTVDVACNSARCTGGDKTLIA
jgi:diguanylate cyclase (GGDEF)-like protein/PAS domain S-box-containing protein